METTTHSYIFYDFVGKDLDSLFNYFPLPLYHHSRRVAVCSALIAGYADKMLRPPILCEGQGLEVIAYLGGMCHDIGKLLLPTPLTEEKEYRQHPVLGVALLEKCKNTLFTNEVQARMILEIVRCHHEKPDGTGFPDNLKSGGGIPLTAGICAVADWLDYRYCRRSDRQTAGDILAEIKSGEGTVFFASIIDCLEYALPEIQEHYQKWGYPYQ